jgi:hypothetical protein
MRATSGVSLSGLPCEIAKGTAILLLGSLLVISVLAARAAAQPKPGTPGYEKIHLKALRSFDPLVEIPAHPGLPTVTAYFAGARGGYLIQFDRPIGKADRQAVEQAGASIRGYVPMMTLEVVMSEAERPAIEALAGVRWVGVYQPSFKVKAELLEQAAADPSASLKLQISFFAGEGNAAKATLRSLGARVLKQVPGRSLEVMHVEIPAGQLTALTEIPQARYIEPVYEREGHNDRARFHTGLTLIANDTFTAGLDPSLDGQSGGFQVKYGHFDTGIYAPHPDFGTADITFERRSDPPGSESISAARWRGVTPQAALHHISFSSNYTDDQIFEREVEEGAQISTNSWGYCESILFGCAPITDYNTNSALWDEGVWDADDDDGGQQQLIVFFSAGNGGLGDFSGCGNPGSDQVGSPGNAKNVITVGANETDRGCGFAGDHVGDVTYFSSRGPVDPDGTGVGLFKPDVTNVGGEWVLSTESSGTGGTGRDDPAVCSDTGPRYRYEAGTSMSAPLTAGLAGAVVQDLVVNQGVSAPTPSLIKALLINGATSLQPSGTCDYTFERDQSSIGAGWGRVNARWSLYGPIGDPNQRNVGFENEISANAMATGESHSRQIEVLTGAPLKVTLAWTDYPAAPGAGSPLVVNDLDLEVSGPDGAFLGNNFVGDWSMTGGTPDRYNVVENVYIQNPTGGTYTITVKGFQVIQDQEPDRAGVNQDFSLFWTADLGACPTCPPLPVHDVAVTSVSVPPSPVFLDTNESVSVVVANEGNRDETFTVSLSDSLAATISNNNQTVTLAEGESTTLDFTWTPTTGGDHNLTATASTVTGETDIADNTKTAPSVTAILGFPGETTVRVNAGGGEYTGTTGRMWSSDTGFAGGSVFSTSSPIGGTTDDTLYQTLRYGNFQYDFAVTNGDYQVTLKFAEVFHSNAGSRVFDVAINGQTVLSSFDIVGAAGGWRTAVDRQFPVSVTSGQITVTFTSVVDNAAINAIEIKPDGGIAVTVSPASATLLPSQTQQFTATVTGTANTAVTWSLNPATGTIDANGLYTAPASIPAAETVTVTATSVADPTSLAAATVNLVSNAPIRVNAGGGQYTDTMGQGWSADTGFTGGATFSTGSAINGTADDVLYQSLRYGNLADLQYQFTVANGDYKVTLKFAELFHSAAGARAFDVAINGETVLTSFDMVAAAGASLKAVDRQFPVSVTTGQITITFSRVVENPAVNAIEITPDSGITVTVSPGSTTLMPSETQQFTATVTGTTNTAVTWSLNPATGTIDANGLYTAPASIPAAETVTVTATSVAEPTSFATATVTLGTNEPIRVNAGGGQYTDTIGRVWSADTGFTGGATFSTSSSINGTVEDVLYQSLRYGNFADLQYQFTVANGDYKVTLKFAELFHSAAGARVFDVAINGETVLTNFDMVAAAGARLKAVDRQFPVSVTTGQITITFSRVVENPAVNAIEITPDSGITVTVSPGSVTLMPSETQQFTATVTGTTNTAVTWSLNPATGTIDANGLYTAPASIPAAETVTVTATSVADPNSFDTATVTLGSNSPIRVNAGGGEYTDTMGQVWSADTGYSGGSVYTKSSPISGTVEDTLYQSLRYGNFADLQYQFSVPNGSYTVNLKFAELFFKKAGKRVFDVTINGETVLTGFDMIAAAGGWRTAVDRQFPVSVTTGQITITFSRVVENPAVNAIEISP